MPVASIAPVQPSLEDVFLEVVGTGRVMMRKTLAVGRKEFRQIARDRRTLLILLFVPAFFLLLYGYALNLDIRHVGLGVDDRDRTAESRALIVGVRQLGLLRSRRDCRRRRRDVAADGSQRGARRARHPAGLGRALQTGTAGRRCRCC